MAVSATLNSLWDTFIVTQALQFQLLMNQDNIFSCEAFGE